MNVLLVLARHWTPGEAKTRLARRWGSETASRLHRAFLAATLRRYHGVADEHWLAYTPPEKRGEFAELAGDDWILIEQSGDSLGQRMVNCCARAFDQCASRVVVIGADSPTLPCSYISDAVQRLSEVPVVVCPADDGGYCLIGMRGFVPPVFEDISWSTSSVLDQTIHRLRAGGLAFATLPGWYDIDTPADFERLQAELARGVDDRLRAAIEAVLNQSGPLTIREARD